jgi:phage shock protein PspC (stress-responsive transcriptional regulator)
MDEEPAGVERELRARVAVDDDVSEPTPSPPVRPPLRRRAQERWVAGVVAGLAEHWGVPPLALRIPLGISAIVSSLVLWQVFASGGSIDASDGIVGLLVVGSFAATVAYIVLWIVLPRDDVVRSPARRFTQHVSPRRLTARYPRIRSIPGFVALSIGGAILAERLGIWQPDLVLAAGLIALGVWLYRRDRAVPTDVQIVEPATRDTSAAAVEPGGAAALPVVRRPRERSPLGWITFGVALLVVCVAAIWTSLADDTLARAHQAVGLERFSTIPALGLLVLAAGLLVGSVVGQARWLILPGLLVVPVVLVASVVRLPFEGQFGDAYLRPGAPATPADNEVVMRRNVLGSIFVDLERLRGRGDVVRELELSTAVGTVTIVVPFDAHVRADAYTGLGTIGLGRRHTQGLEVSDSATLEPKHGDGARIIVHAEVGLGDVYVLRSSPTKRQLHELRREERRLERRGEAA